MSHFSCEHGTKYFPFGRGGREKLIRGMSTGCGSADEALSQLHSCPMQSLPLVMAPELRLVQRRSEGHVSSVDHQCDPNCSHDHPSAHDHSASTSSLVDDFEVIPPVVWREPQSESAQIYSRLADDILGEIFKTQTDAILVSF
jgi:hypothetical protein